jgi:Leucine-rich repeat (LRR) protein
LKCINLNYSQNLIETPDLSGIPNLEELLLAHCTSLSKVHPSIGFLRQLKLLHLLDCKSLERLADEIRLESLQYLNLSGCSRLKKFPDFVGNMTSLWYLRLDGTAIKELPLSFKSLSSLNISDCSRLEKIPKDLISGMKCLQYLRAARSGSDLISLLMPNSFSSLSYLIHLDFSNCNLSDGAIPNDLCCLSSLCYLNLSGNKFTRIPDIWQLSKLKELNLSHCNLSDGAIPNDLSGLFSLWCLILSGNNFTRLPDVAQLSHLERLELEDCGQLKVLPKLPFRLSDLNIKACPILREMFIDQMDVCPSNEIFSSPDCSFAALDFDYDGKPSQILYLDPRSPLWTESHVSLSLISFLTHKIKL